jgi:hypothetical protein
MSDENEMTPEELDAVKDRGDEDYTDGEVPENAD